MFHRSSGRAGRSFQSHKRWNGQRLKKDQLPQLARNRAEPCPAQSNKECQHQAKSDFNALKARRHKKLSPPRTYQFTTQSPLPLFGEPLSMNWWHNVLNMNKLYEKLPLRVARWVSKHQFLAQVTEPQAFVIAS